MKSKHNDSGFSFLVEGADAAEVESAARKIKEIVDAELGVEATILPDAETVRAKPTKAVDPVAVAALVIAIPSAALAVMDIADRIKKRRRLEGALDKVEKKLKVIVKKEVIVRVIEPDGAVKEVNRVDSAELLDYAQKGD